MGPMVQATQAECLELRTSNASLQKDLCAERTKNKEHEALSHTRDAHTRSLMAELALVKGKVKTLEDAKAKLRLDKLEVEARMNKARVAHEKDVDVMKGKMGKMEKEREKERVTHERDIGKVSLCLRLRFSLTLLILSVFFYSNSPLHSSKPNSLLKQIPSSPTTQSSNSKSKNSHPRINSFSHPRRNSQQSNRNSHPNNPRSQGRMISLRR